MASTGSDHGESQESLTTQAHIFKVHTRTEPGEQVLMKYRLLGRQCTLALQQQVGTHSDSVSVPVADSDSHSQTWVSEEVQLETGQIISYFYVIRSADGEEHCEVQRRSLHVKSTGKRLETIADGVFKHKQKGQIRQPPTGAGVSAGAGVSRSASRSAAAGAGAGAGAGPAQQLTLASLERKLLAEINAINARFEEMSAKVENVDRRIDEFVTRERVDDLLWTVRHEVGNLASQQANMASKNMREVVTQLAAVGQTVQDHTGRLAAVELEAQQSGSSHQRLQEEVGALWDHVREVSGKAELECIPPASRSRNQEQEQNTRIDALEAQQQRDQEERQVQQQRDQEERQALHEDVRCLKEWQELRKEELKGALQSMAEKTSQEALALSQQMRGLEEVLQRQQEQQQDFDGEEPRRAEQRERKLQSMAEVVEAMQQRVSAEATRLIGQIRELQKDGHISPEKVPEVLGADTALY